MTKEMLDKGSSSLNDPIYIQGFDLTLFLGNYIQHDGLVMTNANLTRPHGSQIFKPPVLFAERSQVGDLVGVFFSTRNSLVTQKSPKTFDVYFEPLTNPRVKNKK